MFTHATEGVSILSSLESVSTFGRVYLDEFICPELAELVHFVSCIALMQMYFNDYSMIQTVCAICTFFVAAIYQVLRILITPSIFIVRRAFYLSCAAANSRASRTVTRNNHESNIERLDMILCKTASTSLISTPFNVRFMSHRISSALGNFIVNGKRILIGYPGIENPSPSRVLVTISMRHTNSYIIDSSTSHAKSLNILCDMTRRGVGLQQEMFIRTYLMMATLPMNTFHTPRAYQLPMIEKDTKTTGINENRVPLDFNAIRTNLIGYHTSPEHAAHEEPRITPIVDEEDAMKDDSEAAEDSVKETLPEARLLPETSFMPETTINDEKVEKELDPIDTPEPASELPSSTSERVATPQTDCKPTKESARETLDRLNEDCRSVFGEHLRRLQEKWSKEIEARPGKAPKCTVSHEPKERMCATTAANSDSDHSKASNASPVAPEDSSEGPVTDYDFTNYDMESDQSVIAHTGRRRNKKKAAKFEQALSSTCLRGVPPKIAAIMACKNPGKYIDKSRNLDISPSGKLNRSFYRVINTFYYEFCLDLGKSECIFPETQRKKLLYSSKIIRELLTDIVQFAESLYTSRGADVESSFRQRNEAIRKDPMRFLSHYCYSKGCDVVELYHGDDYLEPKEDLLSMFRHALHETNPDGNGEPGSLDMLFEAYKWGAITTLSRIESMSERFGNDIQSVFTSFRLNDEVEDCLDYLNRVIREVEQDLPILYKPLLLIVRLYKPLKKVYEEYKEELPRREVDMKRYQQFIQWADSMDAEQAYANSKDRMSLFAAWDEDKFIDDLNESQERWKTVIEYNERLDEESDHLPWYFERPPYEEPRRRDRFRNLWRSWRHKQ